MAAHMIAARKTGVALLEAKSKCFDLLKLACIRLYSSSTRNEGSTRSIKSTDSDNSLWKQNSSSENKRKGNAKNNNDKEHPGLQQDRQDSDFQFSQGTFDNFEDILNRRRNEAMRSVLVQPGDNSTLQLLQEFGPLEYACFTSKHPNLILAQYKTMRGLDALLSEGSSTFSEQKQFPMKSRLLHCSNPSKRRRKSVNNRNRMTTEMAQHYPVDRLDFSYPIGKSFDEEARGLYNHKCLREYDLRIRFFMCSLLEDLLESVLPEIQVVPYGSCLNGFGWWDGDLDMMMSLNPLTHFQNGPASSQSQRSERTPFKFLTEAFATERMLAQRSLSAVGGVIEMMPRVTPVIRILKARVPIIRFEHYALNLQCDLSLHAMDSIKMTEILYLLSMADSRVQPLMTTIKQWALHHNVTSGGEQNRPTTLGLLCLLIYYLQTSQPAVLPSLRQLQSFSRFGKEFEIENVSYRLPTSASSIPSSTNTQSIESLLRGFFEFYASFDFDNMAISIIEGSTFPKAEGGSPLHMENPLCIGLNICKNVSKKCLGQLQQTMKQSARVMDEMDGSPPSSSLSSDPTQSRLKKLFRHCVNSGGEESVHHVDLDSLFGNDGEGEGEGKKELVKEEEVSIVGESEGSSSVSEKEGEQGLNAVR